MPRVQTNERIVATVQWPAKMKAGTKLKMTLNGTRFFRHSAKRDTGEPGHEVVVCTVQTSTADGVWVRLQGQRLRFGRRLRTVKFSRSDPRILSVIVLPAALENMAASDKRAAGRSMAAAARRGDFPTREALSASLAAVLDEHEAETD